jgi:hypothetical protein
MSGALPSLPVVRDTQTSIRRDLDPSSLNTNSRVPTSQHLNIAHSRNDEMKSRGAPSRLGCPPPSAGLAGAVSRTKQKTTELDAVVKDTKTSPFDIEGTPVDDDPRLWSAGKKVRYRMSLELSSDPDAR